MKLLGSGSAHRPALLIGVLLTVVGVQLISLGLLAELMVHFRRDRDPDLFVDADQPRSSPAPQFEQRRLFRTPGA